MVQRDGGGAVGAVGRTEGVLAAAAPDLQGSGDAVNRCVTAADPYVIARVRSEGATIAGEVSP
eukprot:SAG11_NODE_495_length_8943_cov_274.008028_10_plen_63_part_00